MQAMRLARNRHARWAVPGAAVLAAGGVIAGSAIGVAQASPDLPAKTPAQLLAAIAAGHEVPPLTGTVVETTALGLPALPQAGGPTSLASLLTGSHTLLVYYQDARHYRIAMPQPMSETDLIRDGSTAWVWDSSSNSADKYAVTPAQPARTPMPSLPALTPQQAADDVLQAVGPTTKVSVHPAVTVAGRPAYQLALAPRDPRSTIGSVAIAIDGKTDVPLRVQVFAKGAASPAVQVGYTAISYGAPAPGTFAFTPPPGATVTDEGTPSHGSAATPAAPHSGLGSYGSAWLTVLQAPQSLLAEATAGHGTPSASAGGGAFGKDGQLAVNSFLNAAKPVSGPWGSGKLLHTSLVNVLLAGGDLYVGAVDPSVLYAAVGHATPLSDDR